MFKKNYAAVLLIAIMCVLFGTVSAFAATDMGVFEVYKTDTSLAVGETSQVTLANKSGAAYGESFIAKLNLTYSSDNEEVATVDENGFITAVAPGIAVVTVHLEDNTPAFDDKKLVVTVKAGEGLFNQGFEDFSGDRCSTEQVKSGSQSAKLGDTAGAYNFLFKIPDEEARNFFQWEAKDNCVVEAWFYDDTTKSNTDVRLVLNDTGETEGNELMRFYISTGKGSNYYVNTTRGKFTHTTVGDITDIQVKRSAGWHQVIFDFSEANDSNGNGTRRVYLDGNVIYEESYTFNADDYIKIGGLFGQNGSTDATNLLLYFDEINAYSLVADEPTATDEPAATDEPTVTDEPTATDEPIAADELSIVNADGDKLESLADVAGTTVTAKTEKTSGVIILAIYNAEGALEAVEFVEISDSVREVSMQLPANVTGKTLRAFVWDSLENISPLTASVYVEG